MWLIKRPGRERRTRAIMNGFEVQALETSRVCVANEAQVEHLRGSAPTRKKNAAPHQGDAAFSAGFVLVYFGVPLHVSASSLIDVTRNVSFMLPLGLVADGGLPVGFDSAPPMECSNVPFTSTL